MTLEDPLKSLELTLTFDARDWSVNPKDAWIYGIILGWDTAILDVAALHKWTNVEVERLQRLHIKFIALKDTP